MMKEMLTYSRHRSFRVAWASLTLMVVLLTTVASAKPPPTPKPSVESAMVEVATHLSPPYALYLYESLSRQVLSNEQLLERLDSTQAPLAKDSLWALDVISQSILVEGQDGPYLDVRRVPAFF